LHIGPIAVRPDLQRLGIASALIGEFLTTVDKERPAVFLETDVDRNIALYDRFGFRVISREDILGVDTRFMWRAPATSARPPAVP
jgi:ribosomal protein S18 acetylase RimI-like enzyme